MKIDWTTSARTSCFHAAAAILRQQKCADTVLAAALTRPTERLADVAADCCVSAQLLLAELVPLSVASDNDRRLAELAVARVSADLSSAAIKAIGKAVATLRETFDRASPRVEDELQIRAPVLREQWEAFGPGLMRAIGRAATSSAIVPQATVILVHPFLGGGGQAFASHGLVTFEAVLANPLPELPEVVRLAWLLSQLNLDRAIEPAAMVPAAVAAAADLGLAQQDAETLELARRAWHVDET